MKTNIVKETKQTDERVQKQFLKLTPKKINELDVFLKWTPLVLLTALDILDKKPEDKLQEHFIYIAASELVLNAAVLPLKYIYKRKCPNGNMLSFPSGYAATSVLGSEILRMALKEKHPHLSNASYAIPLATALLRLYHNKHWFSDVLAGALLGVLSVKLSYKLIDRFISATDIQFVI